MMKSPSRTVRAAVLVILAGGAMARVGTGSPRHAQGPPDPSPPHILFFCVDDMGWRDAGFLGSTFFETPSMDRLAAEGMVFTHAYSNGPNCAPSRASLLTGQYTPRHGVYTVGTAERGFAHRRKLVPVKNTEELASSTVTVAEGLRDAGYLCGFIGKWHLGNDPTAHGFAVNVAGNATGTPLGGHFSPYRNPQIKDGKKGEYLTDRLTEEAIGFLRRHHERPCFLFLSHYAVHTPIQAPPDLVRKYRRKKRGGESGHPVYAAMIESVDTSLGRILAELDALGIAKNTVVFFFSDNGGMGAVTSMAPLRGTKGSLHEGGIRVPLVVRWPGTVKAGSTCEDPVLLMDLFPTVIELVGLPGSANRSLDGVSLASRLRSEDAEHPAERALHWHFPAYLEAYDRRSATFRTTPGAAVRCKGFKLLEFFEDGRLELYDLARDPGETVDLALKRPEIVKELHEVMRAWRKEVAAPVPTTPNPAYRAEAARGH